MNMTLVIPTHNRHRELTLLVESLLIQNTENLELELIIVSNLEDHFLRSWVKEIQNRASFKVKYFETGIIGVNSARNLGIKNAETEKIYFLDDDVLLTDKGHLQKVAELAGLYPQAAAFGGGYILPDNASPIDEVYHTICSSWLKGDKNNSINLVGGNSLYNKKILSEQLHFNEAISFGGTETELNLRLSKSGHKFLFFESLSVLHSTDLNYIAFIKKAIRQGMGRSYHEKIVEQSYWQVDTNNPEIFLNSLPGISLKYFKAACCFSLYDFFFHAGYRHGKLQNNGPLSVPVMILCILQTFFQVDSDKILFILNPDEKPFHKKSFPALKFREIFHWYKANVTWRILYYSGMIAACAIGSFIPFSTTGLLTMYYHTKENLRN